MKTIIFLIMLTICLSLPPVIKAQEEYVLSTGDSIEIFIYQDSLRKKGKKSLMLKKIEKGKFSARGLSMKELEKLMRRNKHLLTKENRKKIQLFLRKKGITTKEGEGKKEIIIRPDGKVTIPLIGEVKASGNTIRELDGIITDRLKSYIPNPDVTVMLTGIAGRKNKVYVLGEVGKPGLYPVTGEMSLLKALALAGSVTKNASLSRIYLNRNTAHGREIIPLSAKGLIDKLDLSENIRIYPGDIIYVPCSKIVVLNEYIGKYIKPLEFLVLLFNLGDAGRLDVYGLIVGFTYGIKWVFWDEHPSLVTSSINVPLDSYIYEELNELSCKGILKNDLITTRPLTRNDIALLIKDAEEIEDPDNTTPIDWSCMRALERLEKEFEEKRNIYGYVRTGIFCMDSDDEKEYFDYQKDQNWFGDGLNPRTELSLGGDIFPKLSYDFTGSMWYNGDKTKIDLKESYIKLNFRNLEIEVGRDHLWWGTGYHGSLLLSDNPPPFDMVKLTTRTEKFKFSTFLTRLGKDRYVPEPYLNGMRFEWLPFPDFTLGGSRMIMFMGKGRPNLRLKDIPEIFSGENVGGRLETNQLAGLDFRWKFKNFHLYGTWAGEDQARGLPSAEGYQLGAFVSEFFHRDVDFRLEYAINRKKPHQKATWYEHHLYKTGYHYKGQVIGHHMGGDAQDIFLRMGYRFNPKLRCAFEFDHERHGMIKSVEEREVKYAFELAYDLTSSSSISIRHENWWTKNNNFVEGEDARDSFTRLEWEYRF